MLFGTLQKLARINQFSVTISGFAIKRGTEFKYLGVILDERLSGWQAGGYAGPCSPLHHFSEC